MKIRTTFLVSMALLVCHELCGSAAAIAQVPFQLQSGASPSASNDVVEMKADSQERVGDLYRLLGHVEIQYGGMHLAADEADYNSSTGYLVFSDNVHSTENLQNEDIRARRADYHLR